MKGGCSERRRGICYIGALRVRSACSRQSVSTRPFSPSQCTAAARHCTSPIGHEEDLLGPDGVAPAQNPDAGIPAEDPPRRDFLIIGHPCRSLAYVGNRGERKNAAAAARPYRACHVLFGRIAFRCMRRLPLCTNQ